MEWEGSLRLIIPSITVNSDISNVRSSILVDNLQAAVNTHLKQWALCYFSCCWSLANLSQLIQPHVGLQLVFFLQGLIITVSRGWVGTNSCSLTRTWFRAQLHMPVVFVSKGWQHGLTNTCRLVWCEALRMWREKISQQMYVGAHSTALLPNFLLPSHVTSDIQGLTLRGF